MPLGIQKRTRSQRVAALELPPGLLDRTFDYLRRGDVLLRLGLCVLTGAALWAVTGSWAPSLPYRTDYTPLRHIVARTSFQTLDPLATQEARDRAQREVRHVFEQDKGPLVQLRAALNNALVVVTGAPNAADVDFAAWQEFFVQPAEGQPPISKEELDRRLQSFRQALSDKEAVDKLDKAVAAALAPQEQHGLLEKLPQNDRGNQKEIYVHAKGKPDWPEMVKVADVLIGKGESLKKSLAQHIDSPEVAERVFDWLYAKLPTTLTLDQVETEKAFEEAAKSVGDVFVNFSPGQVLATAHEPLTPDKLKLLNAEHKTVLSERTATDRLSYSLASIGMFIALATLCGVYVLWYEPKLLANLRRFATLLALILITVACAVLAAKNNLRAELVPLLVCAMTMAIAYHQEMALLFSAAIALIVTVAIGQGLSEFVILTAATACSILLVESIRSRVKLVYVGFCVGLVAFLTTVGVSTLDEQPLMTVVTGDAARFGLYGIFAGFLMLGLLPFIESLFAVQTDISLLELGDVAHPLLQELVRRAPGTYNHSINVASIAEAAAESIGARGLLVRVGAYFHDIGKMLKPGYFVENQGQDANRHESLVPAMSTLIIIAHIKDGGDLARQHRLPEAIIDFIQQHHGTTLVEYFYRRANEQSELNPDAGEVEESAFRYPGPKPQSKEAAVLMVADAVESASRALVEPTPSRIESLVHEIAMKRLLDGQFDACGLTLRELATVEDSLAKSLTAVYHGRVKYPDQRTA